MRYIIIISFDEGQFVNKSAQIIRVLLCLQETLDKFESLNVFLKFFVRQQSLETREVIQTNRLGIHCKLVIASLSEMLYQLKQEIFVLMSMLKQLSMVQNQFVALCLNKADYKFKDLNYRTYCILHDLTVKYFYLVSCGIILSKWLIYTS